MKYATLFQLRVRHDYYANGACHELSIMPDAATQRVIDGHRLLLRRLTDRVVLLGECNSNGTLLVSPSQGLTFRFLLNPQNNNFLSFTEITQPNTGRLKFTNTGATTALPGHFILAQSAEEKPIDTAWATAEITVDADFSLPPQAAQIYDLQLTAKAQAWNFFLTTGQVDDDLRIESPLPELRFQKVALPALLTSSEDHYLQADLGLPSTWTGSDQSSLGLDFTVASGDISSQGPVPSGNASIWLSTKVLPVVGLYWKARLELGFTPNAGNQARLHFLAEQADLTDAALNSYCLLIGEAGTGNKLRLQRITEGVAQEIAVGTTNFSGNIALDLEIHWRSGGNWEVLAAPVGQVPTTELSVQDQDLVPGQHFGLQGSYTVASRATAFHLKNLEIQVPFGHPDHLPRNRAIAEMLADRFPDKNQYLFASTGPVAMQANPRKGLALWNGPGALIEHLANPAPEDNGTLFFHI